LHHACLSDSRSAVIPVLLVHPYIDVNSKGGTLLEPPFMSACLYGVPSCVREMLKDSRVKVNEPHHSGYTPLWNAAWYGSLDIIKWWIASGREMDFGKPGDVEYTDAIGEANMEGNTEVVTLLERFKSDAAQSRHAMRVELGWYDEAGAEMFALVNTAYQRDHHSVTRSEILQSRQTTASGAPDGAVLSPGGIKQGDHPRQREGGGLQGTGKETPVVLVLHQLGGMVTLLPLRLPSFLCAM